jgi:hypothetical protein
LWLILREEQGMDRAGVQEKELRTAAESRAETAFPAVKSTLHPAMSSTEAADEGGLKLASVGHHELVPPAEVLAEVSGGVRGRVKGSEAMEELALNVAPRMEEVSRFPSSAGNPAVDGWRHKRS